MTACMRGVMEVREAEPSWPELCIIRGKAEEGRGERNPKLPVPCRGNGIQRVGDEGVECIEGEQCVSLTRHSWWDLQRLSGARLCCGGSKGIAVTWPRCCSLRLPGGCSCSCRVAEQERCCGCCWQRGLRWGSGLTQLTAPTVEMQQMV